MLYGNFDEENSPIFKPFADLTGATKKFFEQKAWVEKVFMSSTDCLTNLEIILFSTKDQSMTEVT